MQIEEAFPFPLLLLVLVLAPVFSVGLWVAVCFLLSIIGGWSRLAEHYRSQSDFSGTKWQLQSGRLGLTNYGNSLTIGANDDGLYLAVFPLFRVGHPPLWIPWREITTTEHQGWLFAYRDFSFARTPSVTLRVLRATGDRIMSSSVAPDNMARRN